MIDLHQDSVLFRGDHYHIIWPGAIDTHLSLNSVSARIVKQDIHPAIFKTFTLADTLTLSFVHIALNHESSEQAEKQLGPILFDTLPKTYFTEVHQVDIRTQQWKRHIEKSSYWLYQVSQELPMTGLLRIGKGKVTKGIAYQDALSEDWVHDTVYDIELQNGHVKAIHDRSQEIKRAYAIPIKPRWRTWLIQRLAKYPFD
jgi:hypothetical protein